MPTIVDILTFMSWINFSLSCGEHEKSFITWGPGIDGKSSTLIYCQLNCYQFIKKKVGSSFRINQFSTRTQEEQLSLAENIHLIWMHGLEVSTLAYM